MRLGRTKRKKRGRRALWYSMCSVLGILATLSYANLEDSLYLHIATKDRLEHAKMEEEYVGNRLEDIQRNSLKKKYDAEDVGFIKPEKVGKIDLRGVDLSLNEEQVFSEKEVEFNVIEQQ